MAGIGVEVYNGARGGSIRIRFMFKGKECRETIKLEPTKGNLAYATRLRGEVINAIAKGTFNYGEFFPGSKQAAAFGHVVTIKTMKDLLEEASKSYAKQVLNGKLSPSTFNGYRKIIEGRLLPTFKEMQITDVTPVFLRQWVKGFDSTGKTTRNVLSCLRSALDDAVSDGIIEVNPLERIALKKLVNQVSVKSDYAVDPFTTEEVGKIVGKAGMLSPMFAFWFETGLRPGELIALDWSKVNLEARTVRIDANRVVKVNKGPKTQAGIRTITLTDTALEALLQQREVTQSGAVFIHPKRKRAFDTDQQIRRTVWISLLNKAGVRYRNPYQVRHTFASHHVSSGANLWWLASQMGHETIEVIIKHYGRWVPTSLSRNFAETLPNTLAVADNGRQQRKTPETV